MVDHFTNVFALPADQPANDNAAAAAAPPPHVPSILLDKPSVQSHWYDGLMSAVTPHELMDMMRDVPLVSAAGEDGVSSGMWKLALTGSEQTRAHVSALFSACLRTSTFPPAWKTSVILPLSKNAHKERSMSNVRPISLQSCLGKLLNKLRMLAHRLSNFFARHPILNPSQRGFIHGGSTTKCIDELLDVWEASRQGGHELHTLFYDIKQAYDSPAAAQVGPSTCRIGRDGGQR